MPPCPLCNDRPGSYYRCFRLALERLLGRYPALLDACGEWHLVSEGDNSASYRAAAIAAWPARPPIDADDWARFEVHDARHGRSPLYESRDEKWPRYRQWGLLEHEDQFLIYLCPPCAATAKRTSKLDDGEFKQLFAYACPCCGFYTLEEQGGYEICKVCFWEDDGTFDPDEVSGPNHMTIREGRENYARWGACAERLREYVRTPKLEERPRFFRYFEGR